MERKNIVILGLAVLLGLMVGSAEAGAPRGQRPNPVMPNRPLTEEERARAIASARSTGKSVPRPPMMSTMSSQGKAITDAFDFADDNVSTSALSVPSASQKPLPNKFQAAGNAVRIANRAAAAFTAGKKQADSTEQGPMLMLEDSPRFSAAPPKTPPLDGPDAPVVPANQTPRNKWKAAGDAVRIVNRAAAAFTAGKKQADSTEQGPMLMLEDSPRFSAAPPKTPPLSRLAVEQPLLTNKDQNASMGTSGSVSGAGVSGRNSIDGVGRVPVKAATFKERFMAGARSVGGKFTQMGSNIRSAGRFAKQRLTPAQQGRVEAINQQLKEFSGDVSTHQELIAERDRIQKAGLVKRGIRNAALGVKNAAARVRNALRRKPKAVAAATTEAEDLMQTRQAAVMAPGAEADTAVYLLRKRINNQQGGLSKDELVNFDKASLKPFGRVEETPAQTRARLLRDSENASRDMIAMQAQLDQRRQRGEKVESAEEVARLAAKRAIDAKRPVRVQDGDDDARGLNEAYVAARAKLRKTTNIADAEARNAKAFQEGGVSQQREAAALKMLEQIRAGATLRKTPDLAEAAQKRNAEAAAKQEAITAERKAKAARLGSERVEAASARRQTIVAERKAKAARLGSERVEAARLRRQAAVEAAKLASEAAPVAEPVSRDVVPVQSSRQQEAAGDVMGTPKPPLPIGPPPGPKKPTVLTIPNPAERIKTAPVAEPVSQQAKQQPPTEPRPAPKEPNIIRIPKRVQSSEADSIEERGSKRLRTSEQ